MAFWGEENWRRNNKKKKGEGPCKQVSKQDGRGGQQRGRRGSVAAPAASAGGWRSGSSEVSFHNADKLQQPRQIE